MPTKSANAKANKARMTMIQTETKKVWATGKFKKYHEALSQACKNLKKEGKL